MQNILVKKASGKTEAFSEEKIRQSLTRSGTKSEVADKILVELTQTLYEGITTKEIYKTVFSLLNRYQTGQGYSYSLKNAIMKLGPSGFPFEKFIGRVFDKLGYQTKVSNIIPGKCLDYEIDVVAKKDGQQDLIECKFHNRLGIKTHSKDALALQAKFEDIGNSYNRVWLVTNTKLTSSAIKYGQCKGIKMLAWHYPVDNSLEKLIEKFKLQPITILSFLSDQDQQILFNSNYGVINDLAQLTESELINFNFDKDKTKQLQEFIASQAKPAELTLS